MKLSINMMMQVVLLVSVTNVLGYIPSIHPNDHAIATMKPPTLTVPPNQADTMTIPLSINNESTEITSKSKVPVLKKKWGTDYEHPEEYWFDDRIHTLGNHGFWGAVHAAIAPISTRVIDIAAYNGVDIRLKLAQELSEMVGKQKARVLDLCCGVGTSTRALQSAFPDATTVIGIDTSKEMVAMADFLTKHLDTLYPFYSTAISQLSDSYKQLKKKGYAIKRVATHKAIKFLEGNAESTNLPDQSFDLVTVMWAFHEAPLQGRAKILNEARRLLSPGGVLAIVDISTDYIPSKTMLAGEPYVQEYQQNIHRQLQQIQGFKTPQYRSVVDHHLCMWTLTRSPNVA